MNLCKGNFYIFKDKADPLNEQNWAEFEILFMTDFKI